MPDTFTATGNWGVLTCCATTGNVLSYDRSNSCWEKPSDGYDNITRLDAEEWRTFYPGEDIAAGHDILDFGSWDSAGIYVGPEMDWRAEYARTLDKPSLAQWILICRQEAERQWAYGDLIDDHAERVAQAFETQGDESRGGFQSAAEFVKWLGEKYDLIPSKWLGA